MPAMDSRTSTVSSTDTIVVKQIIPPGKPLGRRKKLKYAALIFACPPLAMHKLKGDRAQLNCCICFTICGYLPGVALALDQLFSHDRPIIIHRRVLPEQIGTALPIGGIYYGPYDLKDHESPEDWVTVLDKTGEAAW